MAKNDPKSTVRQLEIDADSYGFAEDIQHAKKKEGERVPLYEILQDFVKEGANVVRNRMEGKLELVSDPDSEIKGELAETEEEPQDEQVKTWNKVTKFDNLLYISKKDIPQIKEQIVALVTEGYADPLKVLATISAFQKIFEGDDRNPGVRKIITGMALDILEKNKGKVMVGNFELAVASRGTYDYSNDPIWRELNDKATVAKELLKNREERLKTVKAPDALVGRKPETELHGDELITVRPPIKSTSESIRITTKY